MPPSSSEDIQIRPLGEADLEALAGLMLNAYVDTIDYADEDFDDALDEVRSFFEGTPLLEHSFAAVIGDLVASAVLVSSVDGAPFIGYVMTLGDYKNQGLARRVLKEAVSSLAVSGHERVSLYITDGNRPSEALFRSIGAVRVESE
jgi:predicted N-acetyltransferase YhbS